MERETGGRRQHLLRALWLSSEARSRENSRQPAANITWLVKQAFHGNFRGRRQHMLITVLSMGTVALCVRLEVGSFPIKTDYDVF